jgi:hypothetical protein
MEKKNPEIICCYDLLPRILLARDDLDFLLATLKAAGFTLKIEDDDFVFENLDELAAKRGFRPQKFEIKAEFLAEGLHFAYSLSVSFDSGFTHLDMSGTAPVRGVYLELLHYLRDRPHRWWVRGALTLRPKHDSFLRRNAERLALLGIGSLIGGLISYLVQAFVRSGRAP